MRFRLDPLSRNGISLVGDERIIVQKGSGAVHTGAKILSDLTNVDTAGATDNQALSYDSATNKWIPQTVAGGTGAVDSVNGQTGTVVLDADDIDDTTTTNKFVTATDVTKLSNLSGTNTGDQDLSGYATTASLATVATSGAYSDLSGTPTIPTSVDNLSPSQTGNNGKYLTTDGTNSSWAAIPGGGDLLSTNNLSDLTNVATARTNLGVDAAGTDNSTDVTLAGTGTYLSLIGQQITQDPLTASDVTDFDTEVANNSAVAANTSKVGVTDQISNVVEDTTPQLGGELDAQGNNITDLADITFRTGATGGTIRTGTSAADKFQLQAYDTNGMSYTTLIEADAGTDPYLQLFADYCRLEDGTDPTKVAQFSASSITTGTTRTFTFPDATGTLQLQPVEGAFVDGDKTSLDLNTTHRTSNGTDHTYIDQDVTTTASPTFAGGKIGDNTGNVLFELAGQNGSTTAATLRFTENAGTPKNGISLQYDSSNNRMNIVNDNASTVQLYFARDGGLSMLANNIIQTGNVTPNADSTYTLGTSSLYWSNTYTDVLYLNATASFSGATAGRATLTGSLYLDGDIRLSTNNKYVYVQESGGTWRSLFGMNTGNNYILGGSNNPMQLITSTSLRVYCGAATPIYATSTAVGINTASPSQWLDVNDDSIRVRTAKTPASASATGTQGQIAWDSSYIYICTATNTWKRVAIATWLIN